MDCAVPELDMVVEPEVEKPKPLPVWGKSFEETPVHLRHRYFNPDGKRLSKKKLRAIEEKWRHAANTMGSLRRFK